MDLQVKAPSTHHRRKFPRRNLKSNATVLVKGSYLKGESMELGEGGMRVNVQTKLLNGQKIVVNLFIFNKFFITSLAEVLYQSEFEGQLSYGVRFINLDFEFRRHIRDFIAGKTEEES